MLRKFNHLVHFYSSGAGPTRNLICSIQCIKDGALNLSFKLSEVYVPALFKEARVISYFTDGFILQP